MKVILSLFASLVITAIAAYGFSKNNAQPPLSAAGNDAEEQTPSDVDRKGALTLSNEQNQQKMQHIIHCAALMASHASLQADGLQPGTEAFEQVSYSLGQAEVHALDGGLSPAIVKQRYDKKTLQYFLLSQQDPERFSNQYDAEINLCRRQARLFNPATQMQAIMEEAKRLQQ